MISKNLVNGTKIFWKALNSYFSNRGLTANKIILNGKENGIKDAQVLNSYCVNITQYLNIAETNGL